MERNWSILNRRQVLKTTVASLAGGTVVGSSSARASPPNVQVLKGTMGSPLAVKRIQQSKKQFLGEQNFSGSVVTHDPIKEAKEYKENSKSNQKKIVGYGIGWENNTPHIKISYVPVTNTIGSMSQPGKSNATRAVSHAHNELDKFAERFSGGE